MSDNGADTTSIHVRRARDGDESSQAWLIERFTPVLLAQARYRLGDGLRHVCDPGDLVQDVWAVALPKLGELRIREDEGTPTLIRFLSTTLLNTYRNVLKRHLRSRRSDVRPSEMAHELPADTAGIVTRAGRTELHDRLQQALQILSPEDRDVVLLRGIEQAPAREAAAILGLTPNTLTVRYRRALQRLRSFMGASVLDELPNS